MLRNGSITSILAALFLVGCGGSGSSTSAPGPGAAPTPTPSSTPPANQQAPIPGIGLVPVTNAAPASFQINPASLPPPFATPSATNGSTVVPRPEGAALSVPSGFHIYRWADNLSNVRLLTVAPNGDVFAVKSDSGEVVVLRDANKDGIPETRSLYASGLNQPFGIAFYPPGPNPAYLYVANTGSVVRFPYSAGSLQAGGAPQTIVPDLPVGGHPTRGLVFRPDGAKMYVSVGSASNANAGEDERHAAILEYSLNGDGRTDGTPYRLFGTGLRNPSSMAFNPLTGALWTTVNERDGLGDDLVPDFVTSVREGGFYGWPYFYIGANPEPRVPTKPELAGSVIVPDTLLQAHSAPLGIAFYNGDAFPGEYRNNAFVALHGSWNRGQRTGYKVVRLTAGGGYEDFAWGWVTPGSTVWGRPVGVATATDGSLLISDDGANCIWRVTYGLTPPAAP